MVRIHDAEEQPQSPLSKTIFKSNVKKSFDIFICTVIRLVFVLQSLFCVYYLISYSLNYTFLILCLGIIFILADSVYIIVKRKGKEHMW